MKNSKRKDLIKSNNECLRFIARCPICETKVKGTPEQFTLSDVINKAFGKIERAAFHCPRCHNIATVRIDQITVVEEAVTIKSNEEVTKTTFATSKCIGEKS